MPKERFFFVIHTYHFSVPLWYDTGSGKVGGRSARFLAHGLATRSRRSEGAVGSGRSRSLSFLVGCRQGDFSDST